MKSDATTVEGYLESLLADRRESIAAVRAQVKASLPDGYEEVMRWGLIAYEVPLSRYPNTYNGLPLTYTALGSHKAYCSLYLTGVYGDSERERQLRDAFTAAGKRLDMGKACVRFRTSDDLPLEAIGELIAGLPVDAFLERYEGLRGRP